MKSRQFLNVVMQDHCGGSLMSRIIDPKKHLFYPTTADAQQHLQIQQRAATKTMESTSPVEEVYDGVLRLPPPRLGFRPSSTPGSSMGPGLFPFYGGIRGGESRIFCIDRAGMVSLYDADSGTIQMMPGLAEKKGGWHLDDIISLCVTDAADTTHSFAYPVDPDVLDGNGHSNKDPSSSTILVSFSRSYYGRARAVSIGTYCFDTGQGKWAKAGDWTLPFWSRAFHVPELGDGLLFGIDNKHFWAMDVFGATKTDKQWAPALQHAWVDMDVDPLSDWSLQYYSVAYLGEGRFCIHRSFEVMETDGWGSGEECVDTAVLLTGVEVVRDGSGLQMIKHKSRRLDSNIYYVL